MAKAGRVDEAVEELLAVEKKARLVSDGISTSKLVCKTCETLYDAGEWQKLKEQLVTLPKKRGQLKRATTDMVWGSPNRGPLLYVKAGGGINKYPKSEKLKKQLRIELDIFEFLQRIKSM